MENPAKFVREVRQEMNKVTWPNAKETRTSTIMVLILVMIAAVFFWAVDYIIFTVVHAILGF